MNTQPNMNTENVIPVSPAELAEIKHSAADSVTVSSLSDPGASQMYCSIRDDGTMQSKARIFNSINSPDKRISDCIGETINLANIVAHPIQLVDENSGELIETMRMVLVDDQGTSYEAVSTGIVNAVARILQIFGQPDTWQAPIKVKPVQKGTRNGNNKVTTLKVEM